MKILHVAETIRGGIATVMHHHLEAQTARFGNGSVIALVRHDHIDDLPNAKARGQVRTFHRTGRNIASFLRLVRTFLRLLRQERPDVVHLHSTFAGVICRLCLLVSLGHKPLVVYCPHGWAFLMEGSGAKKKFYAAIERLLLAITDNVICVSNFEKDAARAYGIPDKKLVTIHNGVPIPSFSPKALDESKIKLLFVGRLDYQKGFDLLLDIMSKLEGEPFHLTVVGSGVHEREKPPPRKNITYTGWVSPQETASYYQSADVLIMPSRWEGFAMCPLEAMSHGTPVLASAVCSLPEVITEGVTGRLVPIGGVDQFVEALKSTNCVTWQTMGDRAREEIVESFSVNLMVNKTINLYMGNNKQF